MTLDNYRLIPQYSDIESRKDIDTSTLFAGKKIEMPIIAAPMDTLCENEMCNALANYGKFGVPGIIHRYMTISKQISELNLVHNFVGVAVGAVGDYLDRTIELLEFDPDFICIDVAHGFHKNVENAVKEIRKHDSEIHIMAGNVADYVGYDFLVNIGIDSVRVGVGCGSCCITTKKTAHGLPMDLSLKSIAGYKREIGHQNFPLVIADGGIKDSGDILKCLALGADMVMVGGILAGTDEACGGTNYRGMASLEAQINRGKVSVIEGISKKVDKKGPVHNVLNQIQDGLKSGFSYSGARNLKEFKKQCQIRRIS